MRPTDRMTEPDPESRIQNPTRTRNPSKIQNPKSKIQNPKSELFQKKKFQHFPYQPSEKHQIIPGNQKAKRHRKRYKIDQFKIETM